MYSNPYRAAERRAAVDPAVSDLWSQAAANAARARKTAQFGQHGRPPKPRRPAQRVASVAPAPRRQLRRQPQDVASATPAASAEPLGLFQDIRPNVRALFTGG